ncbi:putative base excision dna repair protein [Phaeomoniella chlamydospora]|uniref:Putative base excision dna repair protein n=1 Tax=Phaeomoniella chlamydospora TaxID=158046 RepID=A0A0G2EZK4_PHACM|nr:putative base excision dna repair protein [Phaeomoniella chlamydospora]
MGTAKGAMNEDDVDLVVKEEKIDSPKEGVSKASTGKRKRSEASTRSATDREFSLGQKRKTQQPRPRTTKAVKTEDAEIASPTTSPKAKKTKTPAASTAAAEDLQAAKLKKYAQYATRSPYPSYPHPTASECSTALSILSSLHGTRSRPSELKASSTSAGCGDSPSVLDALVRTILSQNTSNRNSTAAKLSMDSVYGRSDNWPAIASGGEAKLVSAIRCGGLAQIKSRVILKILSQVQSKYGDYDGLDTLHRVPTEEAFKTLLSFQGVGPKTASCVVLFCLERESFAVDTHVFRISKLLGWVPRGETDREKAQAHLETKVPDEMKYALHILMVQHGKVCGECKAKKEVGAKCKLRDAFREKGGVKDEEERAREVKEEGLQED